MKRRFLARFAGLAERLAAGAAIVYRQRADALAAWVAAGRREDLDGWRAACGPLFRLGVLALVAYIVWSIVRAVPWLMWLVTAAFLRAAWRAALAEPADEPAAKQPVDAPAGPDVQSVLALLREVLDGRPAVHLSTVLAHLQDKGQGEGWTVSDLRARFEALGVPVRPKVKVGGVPTRGVHRDDLNAHFPGWEKPPVSHTVDAA